MENGIILLRCDSAALQEVVLGSLCNQEDIILEPPGDSRFLICGVPGFMANLPGVCYSVNQTPIPGAIKG